MHLSTSHSSNYINLDVDESKELTTEVAESSYGSGYRNCLLSLYSPTSNTSALYLISPSYIVMPLLDTGNLTLTKNGKTIIVTNKASTPYNWFYSMLHF